MAQRLAWPVDLQRQQDGAILVSFPDIPEALTEGATETDALAQARDCLIAAIGGYVGDRAPLPRHEISPTTSELNYHDPGSVHDFR